MPTQQILDALTEIVIRLRAMEAVTGGVVALHIQNAEQDLMLAQVALRGR